MVKTINSLTNLELSRLLRKMAAAYTILGENRFKVIAYENAATAIEHATSEMKDLYDDNKLDSVPGLGASIRAHIAEIFKTGKSRHIDDVLSNVNPAIFSLLEVPGLGPKKAQRLVEKLNIKSAQRAVGELEKAAKSNKIAQLEDFGEKSQLDILNNIERYRRGQIKEKRMVLPLADQIANELIEYLRIECPDVKQIDKLGSLRRQVATIGDIDLAVATKDFKKVIEVFCAYPKKVNLIEKGPTGGSILLAAGRQADLRVGDPKEYGAMLQYFSGSKYHNIRLREYALKMGYSLNEYGITEVKSPASLAGRQKAKIKSSSQNEKLYKFESEEKLYNFLGLDYIPPELRENAGEIEAAKNHNLPKLIEIEDIRGDLHTHSSYDLQPSHDFGLDSMIDMLSAAKQMGYEYFAFTEHNPKTSSLTPSQIVTILKARREEIEKLKVKASVQILTFLEVDIQPNGGLATPDEGLATLDAAIVSIHSSFSMNRGAMTSRVLKGFSNPVAKILGHPTGRLLEQREGFELDWEQIFAFCLEHDKALEINAHPNRLDLPDTLVHEAVRRGVKLAISTDSHNKLDLINMRYGVSVARRGWAEKDLIVNTWPYDRLIKWLHKR